LLTITADDVHTLLDWPSLIAAMRQGHGNTQRPEIRDMLLGGAQQLFVRASIFAGVGVGLKAVTVFPANAARATPLPTVQGAFLLFDEADGHVLAVIDGSAITPWKTAADSALGASILAREDAQTLAMIGAGAMAKPLIEAHLAARPSIAHILLWNRTRANAEKLAHRLGGSGRTVEVVDRLQTAVEAADIISTATLSTGPLVRGEWLKPGAHLDLVGAYRKDMREADDAALLRGRIFVDARETAIEDIGELGIPLHNGVIGDAAIEADLFDLCQGRYRPREPGEITIFKNGGGAHLDLMTANEIYARFRSRQEGREG
jgi:ornithine cyclodeaminase